MRAARHPALGPIVAVAVMAALLFVACGVIPRVAASADEMTTADIDDSTGPLDISSITHRHSTNKQGWIVHRFDTFKPWRSRLFSRGSAAFFRFDTNGDDHEDVSIFVWRPGDRLRAKVFDCRSGKSPCTKIGFARVGRPTRRSLAVAFPATWLGEGIAGYRWYVTTEFHVDAHPKCGLQGDVYRTCPDRSPDTGWLEHSLSAFP